MIDLNSISSWKESLGLLPMKLFSNPKNISDYIMLNGSYGHFSSLN